LASRREVERDVVRAVSESGLDSIFVLLGVEQIWSASASGAASRTAKRRRPFVGSAAFLCLVAGARNHRYRHSLKALI